MKVYVVVSYKYCEIKGVFSSQTTAEAHVEKYELGDYCRIVEKELLK